MWYVALSVAIAADAAQGRFSVNTVMAPPPDAVIRSTHVPRRSVGPGTAKGTVALCPGPIPANDDVPDQTSPPEGSNSSVKSSNGGIWTEPPFVTVAVAEFTPVIQAAGPDNATVGFPAPTSNTADPDPKRCPFTSTNVATVHRPHAASAGKA